MQAVNEAATDICEKGRIFLLKRAHSQLPLLTTQGMKGDNLLEKFWDAYLDTIEKRGLVLDLKQSHMAVLEHLNERIKVQQSYNTEGNITWRDQDMMEVQNRLGHRNLDKASLTVMEQLLGVNVKT